ERAAERGGVQLAVAVDAERGERRHLARDDRSGGAAVGADPEAPDRAGAVVAVEVASARRPDGRAAIDVAAGDGAAAAVRVHDRGPHVGAGLRVTVAPVEDGESLVAAPAVVRQLVQVARRPKIDLLPAGVADVADPEVVVGRVEREAPRVAQAEADD